MAHLKLEFGKNKVEIAVIINNITINGKAPRPSIVNIFTKAAVITSPIPVFLNMLINVEAKNISYNFTYSCFLKYAYKC